MNKIISYAEVINGHFFRQEIGVLVLSRFIKAFNVISLSRCNKGECVVVWLHVACSYVEFNCVTDHFIGEILVCVCVFSKKEIIDS